MTVASVLKVDAFLSSTSRVGSSREGEKIFFLEGQYFGVPRFLTVPAAVRASISRLCCRHLLTKGCPGVITVSLARGL